MPLTRVLIYQEKVIVAEGIFRYLFFESGLKATTLKHEGVTVIRGILLQFDH